MYVFKLFQFCLPIFLSISKLIMFVMSSFSFFFFNENFVHNRKHYTAVRNSYFTILLLRGF